MAWEGAGLYRKLGINKRPEGIVRSALHSTVKEFTKQGGGWKWQSSMSLDDSEAFGIITKGKEEDFVGIYQKQFARAKRGGQPPPSPMAVGLDKRTQEISKARQSRRARALGRRGTILTQPQTLGRARVRRATLLGRI